MPRSLGRGAGGANGGNCRTNHPRYAADMSAIIFEPAGLERGLSLEIPDELRWDDDALLAFCQSNSGYRIERDADGNIIIMEPDGLPSSPIEMDLGVDVAIWARRHGGKVLGASGGFRLANTAVRAPDVSWISEQEWQRARGTEGFVHGCPEFLIEVRSRNDRLATLRRKMLEWIENGARLAWLVDPKPRRVEVWRPGREPEVHEHPLELSAEPECPGLVVDFRRAWECLPPLKD